MASQAGPHCRVRPFARFNATFGRVEKPSVLTLARRRRPRGATLVRPQDSPSRRPQIRCDILSQVYRTMSVREPDVKMMSPVTPGLGRARPMRSRRVATRCRHSRASAFRHLRDATLQSLFAEASQDVVVEKLPLSIVSTVYFDRVCGTFMCNRFDPIDA